jgi:hypothetical protein
LRNSIVVLLTLLALLPSMASGEERPTLLGLRFGATIWEVKKQGVELTLVEGNPGWASKYYGAEKLPRPLKGYPNVILDFYQGYGLVGANLRSAIFANDPSGERLRAVYRDMVEALSRKYRAVKVVETVGLQRDVSYDSFLHCLHLSRCGAWRTILEGKDRTITVQIRGDTPNDGSLQILINGLPEIRNIEKQERMQKAKEVDGVL